MRTQEEYLRDIHKRAAKMRQARERRRTAAWSAVCVMLTVLLVAETVTPHAPDTGLLTGTSLLATETGGYVLTAVVAFMLGVAVTVLLRRSQERRTKEDDSE